MQTITGQHQQGWCIYHIEAWQELWAELRTWEWSWNLQNSKLSLPGGQAHSCGDWEAGLLWERRRERTVSTCVIRALLLGVEMLNIVFASSELPAYIRKEGKLNFL